MRNKWKNVGELVSLINEDDTLENLNDRLINIEDLGCMKQQNIYAALIGNWDEKSREDCLTTLKEALNAKFGVGSLVRDFHSAVETFALPSMRTDGFIDTDIAEACEDLRRINEQAMRLACMTNIMEPEQMMNIKLERVTATWPPEPEEEPGPSEAWIKKQLKYEKNPMRIKQLNIMLNKKRKENRRKHEQSKR
jgi:hypothetical protein